VSPEEYRKFVGIAKGSAAEVGYQLLLAKDLKYIDEETFKLFKAFKAFLFVCLVQ
jgi:four helix bundle protein